MFYSDNFSVNKVRKFVIGLYGITALHDDSPKTEKVEENLRADENSKMSKFGRESTESGNRAFGSITRKRRPTLHKDFETSIVPKPDRDGLQQHFDNLFQSKLLKTWTLDKSPSLSGDESDSKSNASNNQRPAIQRSSTNLIENSGSAKNIRDSKKKFWTNIEGIPNEEKKIRSSNEFALPQLKTMESKKYSKILQLTTTFSLCFIKNTETISQISDRTKFIEGFYDINLDEDEMKEVETE